MFNKIYLVIICLPSSFGLSNITSLASSPRDSSGYGGGGGWSSSWGSETGNYSFFDIALTALAFMSFGIFLLNLLMNALFLTTTQGLTTTGSVIPTITATATGGGTTATAVSAGQGGGTAALIYIRRKRAALELDVDPLSSANILAANVLKSIDAMIEKHECLPKVFCDSSRQAQVIGHGFQSLMPFISFSISNLGEKMGFHQNLPEHLDAILYGMTESNCLSQYPHCN